MIPTRSRLHLAAVAILLAGCSEPVAAPVMGTVAPDASAPAAATAYTATRFDAVPNSSYSNPDVDGNRVVYEDGLGEIIMTDLGTRERRVITGGPAQWPRISGNRIVWQDKRNGQWDIYMYDLSTSTETRLTTNTAEQLQPDISGHWAVWADRRNTPTTTKIWALDLNVPGSEHELAVSGTEGWKPMVDGDWVTYSSRDGGYQSLGDTKAYNLATDTETHLVSGKPLSARFPEGISGRTVLYNVYDDQTGASRSWVYDMAAATNTQVSPLGVAAFPRAIAGNYVYWTTPSCCNLEVLQRLEMGGGSPITISDAGFIGGVAASGERVVWSTGGVLWHYGPALPNSAPQVGLTGDRSIVEGQLASFSAAGSFDHDGDPLTFSWTFGDGSPAEVGPASTHGRRSHSYPDNGNFTLTLVVTDGRGGATTSQMQVPVTNAAPSATLVAPSSATPGASFTLELTGAADAGSADVAAGFTYAFNCGNGVYTAASGPTASCTAPSSQGNRTVGGRITDKDGGSRTYTATVPVSNAAPTAIMSAPSTAVEGTSITVKLTDPQDAPADLAGLTYRFDCGSGTYGAASASSATSCLLDDSGERTVRARIIDAHGAYSEYAASVSVSNVAPTATFAAPGTVDMDASFSLTLSGASDPSSADLAAGLRFEFDCGTGAYGAAGPNATATCDAGAGRTLAVRARVTDKDGGATEYRASVAVRNVAPTARFAAPASVTEGAGIALRLADATDTPSHAGSLTFAFDCGSGYGTPSAAATATCATSDDDVRTVRGKVIDPDGAFTEYAATVRVANVAPVVTMGGTASVVSGGTATITGAFTDPGTGDAPWSAVIEWGDGTSSTLAGTPGAPVTASHRYLAPGTVAVRLVVTDKDGGQGSATHQVTVTRAPVGIDVLPGSDENPFRLNEKGNGNLPVAILGAAGFDAGAVQVGSVRIVGAGAPVPVANKGNGQPMASLEDVNGDGIADLVLHFDRAALIESGAIQPGTTRLTLHAVAAGGVQVAGSDAIRVMSK
ncbi:MAG TPA: PKD domain-containing protein [Gemmatimonadaceae bacterium]